VTPTPIRHTDSAERSADASAVGEIV
jgi:hypothetical protein